MKQVIEENYDVRTYGYCTNDLLQATKATQLRGAKWD